MYSGSNVSCENLNLVQINVLMLELDDKDSNDTKDYGDKDCIIWGGGGAHK